jgi:hypothetical protein
MLLHLVCDLFEQHSIKFCSGNLKEEVVVNDTGLDGRMILKGVRYRREGIRMYLCGLLTNFCENAH